MRLVAAIDQARASGFHPDKVAPLFQAAQCILADRGAGLDLDGINRSALTHQQIDFVPGAVTPKAQVGWPPGIQPLFQLFGN